MNTRPIPPHGTPARYKGTPTRPACRCIPCTRAAVRDDAQRTIDRLAGRPRRVPAGPVAEHILKLREARLSDTQIARAAGIHQTVVGAILGQRTVARRTAEKVLAVPLSHKATVGYVPALGATRRIRALYVQCHSPMAMARELGISHDYLGDLARGIYERVLADFDQRVRTLYTQRSTSRGKSTRSGKYATAHGWHGPLAWNDIDDPDEQPEIVEDIERELTRNEFAPLRAEEIRHLASFNIAPEEIAHRVGVTAGYVRAQLSGERAPGWREKTPA